MIFITNIAGTIKLNKKIILIMLRTLKNLSLSLGVAFLMVSCAKELEDINPSSLDATSTSALVSINNVSPFTYTNFTTTDGKTWSFTIKKTGAFESNGGAPSQMFLAFTNCNDQLVPLDVMSATLIGKGSLEPAITSEQLCNSSAATYLKLTGFGNNLGADNVERTITITFNTPVSIKSALVVPKAANNCYSATVFGATCDIINTCGLGQGAFHKAGSWKGYSVTLGGYTYSEAEGLAIMNPNGNNAGGLADSRAAFSQGATVLLNRQMKLISANAYDAQLMDINNYLMTLDKLTAYSITNMPTGNAAAKAAAGFIGDNIKCEL
jgi:hypothetical protein